MVAPNCIQMWAMRPREAASDASPASDGTQPSSFGEAPTTAAPSLIVVQLNTSNGEATDDHGSTSPRSTSSTRTRLSTSTSTSSGSRSGLDFKQGDYRWLTVRVPGNPDVEIFLEQPGPPLHDEATAEQLRELIAKGALGGLSSTPMTPGALRDAPGARCRFHPGADRPLLRHRHGASRPVRQRDPDPRAQDRHRGSNGLRTSAKGARDMAEAKTTYQAEGRHGRTTSDR